MRTRPAPAAAALLGLAGLMTLGPGCGSDGDPAALPRLMQEPVVPGLLYTDGSCEVMARFGDPVIHQGVRACPNPGDRIDIDFEVPYPDRVRVEVYEAAGPGDPPTPQRLDPIAGAVVATRDDPLVVVLVDREHEQGRHVVVWNGRDESGAVMPTGYYRVVLRQAAMTRIVDVFHVDIENFWLPPGYPMDPY